MTWKASSNSSTKPSWRSSRTLSSITSKLHPKGSLLRRALDLLLYSNLFIALCAVALTWSSSRLLGLGVPDFSLLLLVGGGTLALYLALRIDGAKRAERQALTPDRLLWVQQHQPLAWALLLVSLILGGIGFMGVATPVRLFLLPAAALGLAYGWPLLPLPLHWRLRRRNFLKIVLIGLVWAWVTVVLPAIDSMAHSAVVPLAPAAHGPLAPGVAQVPPVRQVEAVWAAVQSTWTLPVGLLFASRFFLVLGVTLPFDIRDIEQDRIIRLETLATAFGPQRTRLLALTCLGASCALMLGQLTPLLWLAYALPCLLAAWGIARARPDGQEYLYLGLLDGTVVLQALLVEGVRLMAGS
jgi:4-hydroxybenzoate polyprenyltransferase